MIDIDVIESVLSTDDRYLDICDKADILEKSLTEESEYELIDDLDDDYDIVTDIDNDNVLETNDILDSKLEEYMDDYADLISDEDGDIIDMVAGME